MGCPLREQPPLLASDDSFSHSPICTAFQSHRFGIYEGGRQFLSTSPFLSSSSWESCLAVIRRESHFDHRTGSSSPRHRPRLSKDKGSQSWNWPLRLSPPLCDRGQRRPPRRGRYPHHRARQRPTTRALVPFPTYLRRRPPMSHHSLPLACRCSKSRPRRSSLSMCASVPLRSHGRRSREVKVSKTPGIPQADF